MCHCVRRRFSDFLSLRSRRFTGNKIYCKKPKTQESPSKTVLSSILISLNIRRRKVIHCKTRVVTIVALNDNRRLSTEKHADMILIQLNVDEW